MGILRGLFVAWLLSLFGFMGLVQSGVLELFNVEITSDGYYIIFVLLSFIHNLNHNNHLGSIDLNKENKK